MNSSAVTVLKIVAAVVLLFVVFHFWPALSAIAFAGVAGVLGLGAALAVGLTLVLAVTAGIGLALLCGLVALGVSLAPLWIPVLAIIGLIAIIRSFRRSDVA